MATSWFNPHVIVSEVIGRFFTVEHRMNPGVFGEDFVLGVRFPRGNRMMVASRLAREMVNYSANSDLSSGTPFVVAETLDKMSMELMTGIETWIRIAKDELKFEDILRIRDIEQRMVALKRYGVEKVLHDAQAELVDATKRGNELYMIPEKAGLFSTDAFYLKYKCPSTGRLYISGVPPEMGITKDADACMAWKHGLATDAYKMLFHES